MNKIWILIKAQVLSLIPINIISLLIALLFLCIYNIMTALTLVKADQSGLIPAYMVSITSIICLFLTTFYSNGILFNSRDTERLLSLPVKHAHIYISKISCIYLFNFIIVLTFMLPAEVIWILNTSINIIDVSLYSISIFFTPLLPMCLAICLGITIEVISSFFKRKNIVALLFSFFSIGLIGFFTTLAMKTTDNSLNNIRTLLAKQITKLYPLSSLFISKNNSPIYIGITLFIMLSSLIFIIFIKFISCQYSSVSSNLKIKAIHYQHKVSYEKNSIFYALCKNSINRFFSSYTAVLNSTLSIIVLCVFSLFFIFHSEATIDNYFGINNSNELLGNLAPLFIASMLSLSCPAAFSLSLEGKNIWILQSAPITVKSIVDSKITVNLILHFIGYLVSIFACLWKLKLNHHQMINLILVPICYSVFIILVGISLNKRYPNYKWTNEIIIVKQSMPVIVSGLIGMLFLLLPMLLQYFFNVSIIISLRCISVILMSISLILYSKLKKTIYL